MRAASTRDSYAAATLSYNLYSIGLRNVVNRCLLRRQFLIKCCKYMSSKKIYKVI